MSGFSTPRSNIDNISKSYGSILRGYGPPVPKAGVVGDLYMDVQTFQLFEKRSTGYLDDWGHYLFILPSNYVSSLKWFGPSRPSDSIGVTGDYYLQWGGYNNYGMQLTVWGPKGWAGWPENGTGTSVVIVDGAVHQFGLLDEGPNKTDMALTQLLAIGLFEEYVIPALVTADINDSVVRLGVQTTGKLVTTPLNNLYTAEDGHAI